MTPLFLDQCPQKNPTRENRCSYLRVFSLSNIRVQSGCRNWPTQQRISLAAIPHRLREISQLKPHKILPTALRHKTAPATLASAQSGLRQPLSVSRWPCISLSQLASTPRGPASALWPSASDKLASLVLCAALGCLCMALHEPLLALRHSPWLLRYSPDTIFAFSVSLYSMPLSCSPDHYSISLSKPRSRE